MPVEERRIGEELFPQAGKITAVEDLIKSYTNRKGNTLRLGR